MIRLKNEAKHDLEKIAILLIDLLRAIVLVAFELIKIGTLSFMILAPIYYFVYGAVNIAAYWGLIGWLLVLSITIVKLLIWLYNAFEI